MRQAWTRRVRVRPNRDGLWFIALLFGVLAAAVNTGNNLLYVVLACLLSLLVVANVLAEVNLRGVVVRRELPDEVFAETPAAGFLVIRSRRPRGQSWTIHVEDLAAIDLDVDTDGAPVLAQGVALVIPPNGEVRVPVRWVFSERGPARLGVLRVSSSFPFGILRRSRTLVHNESLLVYPRPGEGGANGRSAAQGVFVDDPSRKGTSEDVIGFRAYVPGDSLRDIHWTTSARSAQPMVVQRAGQVSREVVIRLDVAQGPALEAALRRATGAVLAHLSRGHAVGLELPSEVLPPRAGPHWRRRLLDRLARYGLPEDT